MIFKSLPYEVEIEKNGKCQKLPVFNAEGVFKSLRLDECKEKILSQLKEYNEFSTEFQALPEEDRNKKETLDKLSAIHKKLRLANVEYLRECIKDVEKYETIIDEITPGEMQVFMTALERAMFGRSDEEGKKKISTSITSKNSSGGATPRKRLKRGRRSN